MKRKRKRFNWTTETKTNDKTTLATSSEQSSVQTNNERSNQSGESNSRNAYNGSEHQRTDSSIEAPNPKVGQAKRVQNSSTGDEERNEPNDSKRDSRNLPFNDEQLSSIEKRISELEYGCTNCSTKKSMTKRVKAYGMHKTPEGRVVGNFELLLKCSCGKDAYAYIGMDL